MEDRQKRIITVRDCFKWGRDLLAKSGIIDASFEACLLLAETMQWDKAAVFTNSQQTMSEVNLQHYQEQIRLRAQGVPVAYITGHKDFLGFDLKVTPAVLIPRPETELLVLKAEQILKEMQIDNASLAVADVCTGSGAIALALAGLQPQARVIGLDISGPALKVAESNRLLLEDRQQILKGQVVFINGDLLQPLLAKRPESSRREQSAALEIPDRPYPDNADAGRSWPFGTEQCLVPAAGLDLITANPPYLTKDEMDDLQLEVSKEPSLALCGGNDGLELYPPLAGQAWQLLKKGGWLLTEIGYTQGRAVKEIFQTAGFQQVMVLQDYGGCDRLVLGRK